MIPSAGTIFSEGAKYMEVGNVLRFSTEIAVYLGNGRYGTEFKVPLDTV